ncbi:MAG: hypothetical protein WCL37_06710 [Chrysiogenales bacterium]
MKPLLPDTLSFENYTKTGPASPTIRFCRHVPAPLALMARNGASRIYLLKIKSL